MRIFCHYYYLFWLAYKYSIPIDLRDSMYCYGVSAGGAQNWLFALQRSVNETNTKDALVLISSLGCVKDERILKS